MSVTRRRRVGAEIVADGVHFRVWAPAASRLSVVLEGSNAEHGLARERNGYFGGVVANIGAGARYRFRIDDAEDAFPDPASRYQPDGPHGASEVIDGFGFAWTDEEWQGIDVAEAVIYETHIGTFTTEGTFAAAIERLDALVDLGINVVELMPVAEFPGRFGWGYDGVDVWAPTRLYGRPDDFRRFVAAAHARGIAVILDVVYNHLGPDGCYLTKYSPHYFTDRYENEWGKAINFDGDESESVREFFFENAAYWIDEFHLDGLRLDATQSMHDQTRPYIVRAICDAARAAAEGRTLMMIGENEPQDVTMLREHGLDALWNDDWHHAAVVALTGKREAYYTDYRGRAQEFAAMATLGFLYQGQHYRWQKKRRGTPSIDVAPQHFILYLENHDQVANSVRGDRMHVIANAGELRAMTALLLLSPQTPMLFQGQDFASSSPFVFFADHEADLAKKVQKGRHDFLAQFPSMKTVRGQLPIPHATESFERCKLDWREREANVATVSLHRDLIALRRRQRFNRHHEKLVASVITDRALVLRWYIGGDSDRLLIINLDGALAFDPAPEPLLAPTNGSAGWEILWSSEAPEYGGRGTAPLESDEGWRVPGKAAVLLKPVEQ